VRAADGVYQGVIKEMYDGMVPLRGEIVEKEHG